MTNASQSERLTPATKSEKSPSVKKSQSELSVIEITNPAAVFVAGGIDPIIDAIR